MNEINKTHQENARTVLEACARDPRVQATTIGGSVARGVADDCSDVDVFAYCDVLPTESECRETVTSLGGTWWSSAVAPHGQARRTTFGFNDSRMDLDYVLVSRVESELDRVLVRHEWGRQQFVGGFYDCEPVTGCDLANAWIKRVRAYPDGLQTAMINQHLRIEPLWVAYECFIRRDDFFQVRWTLIRTMERVLGTLLGLNRLYKPSDGYKRIERLTGLMSHAPDRLCERIRNTFERPEVEALDHGADIVEDTFDLVEAHCPRIDVASARAEFRGDSDMGRGDEGRRKGKGRGTKGRP